MRREYKELTTVGELRAYLDGVPDETPLVRRTHGYFQVYKAEVGAFVGELLIGHEEVPTICVKLCA